jgi:hypothetical protein
MPLNTTRTPPQRSFGRRHGAVSAPTREPAPTVPVKEILQDAQAAPNWLSEITGQSRPATPQAIAFPADDQPVASEQPARGEAAGVTALDVVGRSLAVMGRNPVTFLALVAAVALTEQGAAFLPTSLGLPGWMILPLLTTIACMALYAAAFNTATSSLKGERVNLDLGLRAMACTPKSAYGAIALTVSSLSLLLIFPAIGFAWRWALAAPVAIVEGGDARARSLALATPHRGQIRQLVWLLAGLSLLRGLLMMPLSSQSMLAAVTGDWLFPMLLTLLAAVMSAVLYRDLAASPAAS